MVLCGVRVSANAEGQEFSVVIDGGVGWKKDLWRSLKVLGLGGGSYLLR
jgi:hypothetical protein